MPPSSAFLPAVRIEKIFDLPHYTEGPAVDGRGNGYVTTLGGGTILQLSPTGAITEWGRSTCPNGQVVLPDGDHLLCDSRLGTVSRFSAGGQWRRHEVEGACAGKTVYSPNDLVVDSNGGIYFTDSIRREGRVFYVSGTGRQYRLAEGLDYPNGLALSPDERQLFVAESYRNRIRIIRLSEPGIAAGVSEVFAGLPGHASGKEIDNLPDGMALDDQGRLWIAHYGMQAIQVVSAQGDWLFSIDTGLPLTSNLIFLPGAAASPMPGTTVRTLLVTGGYGEPGPGAVLKIHLSYPFIDA